MEATAAATKLMAKVGVAKKRWQKRGGRKEVTKKRWCRGEWQKRGGKKEVAKKR